MATEKQIAANRNNALKSSGPKSALGKKISSRNSTRHGFYSTNVLLPAEDKQAYLYAARMLIFAHGPRDHLEEVEVKTIIEARWQLRRINFVEADLFQCYGLYDGEHRGVGTAFAHDATQGNAFSKLGRYKSSLTRELRGAEKRLEELKARPALMHHTNENQ